jgi:O-succinylbenzoic acid--CoA ligase
VLSLRNHLESARASNANIPLESDDTWLLSLPLHHVAGFGVLFRCLMAGATISIPPSGATLQTCISDVTHVSLVARQLAQLLDAGAPLNALKAILLGGSAIPAPLIDRAFAAGLSIHTSYGMTETATQIAATPPGATRAQLASSGRPLVPGTIRIADDGRIHVMGPARFLGYWDGGALSCPFDAEGWFTTSDCGYFDDDGFLYITGRADNVFIAGGENIQPEEIERVLCALPGIMQAIVVPVAHPEFGATPVAFVDDGEGREAELRAALAGALPRFAQPHLYFPWPTHLAVEGLKIQRAAFSALAEELMARRRADR